MEDEAVKLIHKFKIIKHISSAIALCLVFLTILFNSFSCETDTLIIKWGYFPLWLTSLILILVLVIYFGALVKINLEISYLLTRKCKPTLYYEVFIGVNKTSGEMLQSLELETAFYNGSFDYGIALAERLMMSKNTTYMIESTMILNQMYFFTENLDGLERLKAFILEKDKSFKNKAMKKKCQHIVSANDIYTEMLKENYFKAEELFKKEAMINPIKNTDKFVKKYTLAAVMSTYIAVAIYVGKNEGVKAKSLVEFIIAHGGETFYVKKVKELFPE